MKKTDYDVGESIREEPDALNAIMLPILSGWVRRTGRLPQPCPDDFRECVAWWTTRMQEPQKADESREEFALRCRSALQGFLLLTDLERAAVVSGVLDDRVPYRGDGFAFFRGAVEETYEMRGDHESYRRRAVAKMRRALAGGEK